MTELNLGKLFSEMGVSMATLSKVATLLENDPTLRKSFEDQFNNKDFDEVINKMYNELNKVLDHGESPNIR